MYNFSLVKRRKRNRRVAIASIIGAIGVIAMIIVAFLGRNVGTFTVNLKNEGVELAMDTSSDFQNPTTYLSATGVDKFSGAHAFRWFLTSNKYSFEKIHNEDTDYKIGKEGDSVEGIRFFKYTFFVKNVGKLPASYDMTITMDPPLKPSNGAASVEEYLRLMIFEGDIDFNNYGKEDYERDVYAKARASVTGSDDVEGKYREYVSANPDNQDHYYGEAEKFLDESTLAKRTNMLFEDEKRMYTLLFWLEGWDPECDKIPNQASLRIGAKIDAYPYEK